MIRVLGAFVCVLGLSACGTVTTGGSQSVAIRTEPPGAACTVQRQGEVIAEVRQTPGTVTVDKSSRDLAVDCNLPGHYPGAAVLPASPQPASLGNIVLGGFIGYGVDLASGAASEYPRGVRIWLTPFAAGTYSYAPPGAVLDRRRGNTEVDSPRG